MKRISAKLTYANVVSTLCLLLVVGGGTAYAGISLAKDSVGSAQIKEGAVTPSKLSHGAKRALKGATGATGAVGPAGPQGVPGVAGVASVKTEVINSATTIDNSEMKELTVQCPHGPVLGGGYVLASEKAAGQKALVAVRSYPVTKEAWLVRAFNTGPVENWEVTVSVVCSAS